MSTTLRGYIPLLARAFLSAIFVMSGLGKISGWDGTIGYMEAHGLPFAGALLALTIAVEVLGGLSVLIGWKARWGALVLAGFLVPTTLVFHAFWSVPEAEQMLQTIMFMKNLTIIGGLLFVYAYGAGRLSVDCRGDATAPACS